MARRSELRSATFRQIGIRGRDRYGLEYRAAVPSAPAAASKERQKNKRKTNTEESHARPKNICGHPCDIGVFFLNTLLNYGGKLDFFMLCFPFDRKSGRFVCHFHKLSPSFFEFVSASCEHGKTGPFNFVSLPLQPFRDEFLLVQIPVPIRVRPD
jgi:hypothetical protein